MYGYVLGLVDDRVYVTVCIYMCVLTYRHVYDICILCTYDIAVRGYAGFLPSDPQGRHPCPIKHSHVLGMT